jgi:hypothetical protein
MIYGKRKTCSNCINMKHDFCKTTSTCPRHPKIDTCCDFYQRAEEQEPEPVHLVPVSRDERDKKACLSELSETIAEFTRFFT